MGMMKRIENWIRFRMRSSINRSQRETDLKDEFEAHLAMIIEDRMAEGMTRGQARREALKEFGNVDLAKETCRDVWGFTLFQMMGRSFKGGLRQIFKFPMHSAFILLILVFTIGFNASIYSGVLDYLIRPFNYPDPDRVVVVGKQWKSSGSGVSTISSIDFLDIEEQQKSFEAIGFVDGAAADVRVLGNPRFRSFSYITPGIWEVTAINPMMGRVFTETDIAEQNKVVVISHALWKGEFTPGSRVVGQMLHINGEPHEIIGVMPKEFSVLLNTDTFWLPKVFSEYERSEKSRGRNSNHILARLAGGVSLSQARQELAALYERFLELHPKKRDWSKRAGESYGVSLSKDFLSNNNPALVPLFLGLQAAGILLLLVGCMNMSSLMLAKGVSRLPELSLRRSLGASRMRIFSQLVSENLILFIIGALGSLVMTHWLNVILDSDWMGPKPPVGNSKGLNYEVVLAGLGAAFIAMVFSSTLPAFLISRKSLYQAMGSARSIGTQSVSKNRLQNLLVTGQIALTCLLVLMSGLFYYNISKTTSRDFGIEIENRLGIQLTLPQYRYGGTQKSYDYQENLVENLLQLPNVLNAAISTIRIPLQIDGISNTSFKIKGYSLNADKEYIRTNWYRIQHSFFDTMGVSLLRGRLFNETDTKDSASVAIVSKSAMEYFSEFDIIGSTLQLEGKEYQVVGVVEDTRDYSFMANEPEHTIFFPHRQSPGNGYRSNILVHYRGPEKVLTSEIVKTIGKIDPELEYKIIPMWKSLNDALVMQRVPMIYASIVAVVSLLLASFGLYGLISYTTEQRKQEFGIRKAIGASNANILSRVVKWGMPKIVLGLIAGAVLCAFGAISMQTLLAETSPYQPQVYIAVLFMLSAICSAAIFVPAIRASNANPIDAIRCD